MGRNRFRFFASRYGQRDLFCILGPRPYYIWKLEESNIGDRLPELVEITGRYLPRSVRSLPATCPSKNRCSALSAKRYRVHRTYTLTSLPLHGDRRNVSGTIGRLLLSQCKSGDHQGPDERNRKP